MKGHTIVLDQKLLRYRQAMYQRRLNEYYRIVSTKITQYRQPPSDITRCLKCKRPFEVGDTIVVGKTKAYHIDCYYEHDVPDDILEEDDYFIENGETIDVKTLLED